MLQRMSVEAREVLSGFHRDNLSLDSAEILVEGNKKLEAEEKQALITVYQYQSFHKVNASMWRD